MKNKVFALLAIAAATVQSNAVDFWSKSRTYVGTNVAYVAVSASGTRTVNFIEANSNNSGATLSIWDADAGILVTNAAVAATSNLLCAVTTSLVVGDNILIRSVANDTYQWAIIWETNSAGIKITNDNHAAALDFALSAGDVIYPLNQIYSLVIGTTTKTLNNDTVLLSSPNASRPMLIKLATSGATTNGNVLVSGCIQ